MNTIERWFGFSIANIFPRSWGPGAVARTFRVAQELNMKLQLLAFCGWNTSAVLYYRADWIGSMEYDLWRDDSLLKTIGRTIRNRNVGLLLSPFIFGASRKGAYERLERIQMIHDAAADRLPVIDHPGWSDGIGLVEVSAEDHPELSTEEYLELSNGLVADTYHLRFPPVHTDPLTFAEALVTSGKVKLVHFQTRDENELKTFFSDRYSELRKLTEVLLEAQTPVVIELHPALTKWGSHCGVMRNIRDEIADMM